MDLAKHCFFICFRCGYVTVYFVLSLISLRQNCMMTSGNEQLQNTDYDYLIKFLALGDSGVYNTIV